MPETYSLNGCAVLRRGSTWPLRVPHYRGVVNGFWWPLREFERVNRRAGEFTAELEQVFRSRAQADQFPEVTDNGSFLRSYIEVCRDVSAGSLYSLVCASIATMGSRPSWLAALCADCEYLGIDVTYPSGSYSFINDDYFDKNGEVFAFLKTHLNANGLFNEADHASRFIQLHNDANLAGANLETLDGAITMMLWEDSDLSRLLRAVNL